MGVAYALAKAPKPARFTWVSGKSLIGTGDTRMELYPVAAKTASG